MTSYGIRGRCVPWLVLIVIASSSTSARADQLAEIIGTQKVIKRGDLKEMRQHPVSLAGRRTVTAGELASSMFIAEHQTLVSQLRDAAEALFEGPTTEYQIVELEAATILSITTRIIVKDPKKLIGKSPIFAKMIGGKKATTLDKLTTAQRENLGALKLKVLRTTENHPLRAAAQKSDQHLLTAILAGKGTFWMTSTLVVPKQAPKMVSGKVVAPKRHASGSFAYNIDSLRIPSSTATASWSVGSIGQILNRSVRTLPFIAGFTVTDSWEKHNEWGGDVVTLKLGATAWYGYGLRIPMEAKATIEPTTMVARSSEQRNYKVTLEANIKDGDKAFYESVGLTGTYVHNGDELLLDAGFQVRFRLYALGDKVLDQTLPSDDAFEYSQSFRPPFGACGSTCGPEFWIPAWLTHTNVDFEVLEGSVRAGVKVSGKGTVSLDFESLFENEVLPSHELTSTDALLKHTLSFDNGATKTTMVCTADLVPDGRLAAAYGYRVSKPTYLWDLELIPGIRADLTVDLFIWSGTYSLDPVWLDSLGVAFGSIPLAAHAGTKATYEVLDGRRTNFAHPAPHAMDFPAGNDR